MKKLLILSGKGGTGKTTVASAFIKLSSAQAFADCDVDAPNLHLVTQREDIPQLDDYFGLDKAFIDSKLCTACDLCYQHCRFDAITKGEPYSINFYDCEGCGVCEVICPVKAITLEKAAAGKTKLYSEKPIFSTAKLNMGFGNSGLLVSQVKSNMTQNAEDVNFAIVDGSPGIGCPVIASLSGVEMVLIVTEPSLTGISDMKRIVKTARGFDVDIAVCINKHDTNKQATKEIKSYIKKEDLAFVGSIPYDDKAIEAINQGKTIIDIPSKAERAVKLVYLNVARLLLARKA